MSLRAVHPTRKPNVHLSHTPYTQYPLFLGYDVDPLLKKEVFTLKNQVFPKIPSKKRVFGVGGNQNPVSKWSTQNHASRIKKADTRSYFWLGLPLT